MSYVLGAPIIRGNSQVISVEEIEENAVIKAGSVVCQDNNGKIVSYASGIQIAGIAGRETLGREIDVLRVGLQVVVRLAEGVIPNGEIAYVSEEGLINTSGDIVIGNFINSEIITGIDALSTLDVENCALINVNTNFSTSSNSGGGSGGVTQAQVDSSIKSKTDPIIDKNTEQDGRLEELEKGTRSISEELENKNTEQDGVKPRGVK